MQKYKLRYGYNIPLQGQVKMQLSQAASPSLYYVYPSEFHFVKAKLQVEEGSSVKIGSPLFFDKKKPELRFVSPAAGSVHAIQYGPRRSVERIVIAASGEASEQWPSFKPGEIASCTAQEIKELFLKGGMWPLVRQRPFDIIADPERQADAVFVNAMDTAPLAGDPEFMLQGRESDFRLGMEALGLFSKNLHLVVGAKEEASIFSQALKPLSGISLHSFRGPHPAGLVGTHIHRICPLSSKRLVWYLNARDVVLLGSFLRLGQYPTERVISLAGPGLQERGCLVIRAGASLEKLLSHKLDPSCKQRILSGNVLTGREITLQDSLGFYDNLVSVLPCTSERSFLGWMRPGWKSYSWSRAFAASFLAPKRLYAMTANKNGEERAFVKTGDYEKLVGIDILPAFLSKAILTEDIELMEALGIYETAPEDLALCAYACPSKVEFPKIIRKGLDLMLAESGYA